MVSTEVGKHTPGPWRKETSVGGHTIITHDDGGESLARLLSVFDGGLSAIDANARLIAAAPELLDDATQNDNAFTWLAEQMNSITDNAKHWNVAQIEALAQDLRVGIERNQKRTRAAIAKATLVFLLLLVGRPAVAQTPASEVPASVVQQLLAERDDRPFHVAQSTFIASAMADLAVTEYQIGRGLGREGMLGAGLERRPIALGAVKGGLTAAAALLFQRIHRDRPKLAFWMAAIASGVEIAATAHNARIGGGR